MFGRYGRNPALPTVTIYGHYDVVTASQADGAHSLLPCLTLPVPSPTPQAGSRILSRFVCVMGTCTAGVPLTTRFGTAEVGAWILIGLQGPILATLFALRELQLEAQPGKDLGVNLAFVYEGEEESEGAGCQEAIRQQRDWLGATDVILIMNTYWTGARVCALRGYSSSPR